MSLMERTERRKDQFLHSVIPIEIRTRVPDIRAEFGFVWHFHIQGIPKALFSNKLDADTAVTA